MVNTIFSLQETSNGFLYSMMVMVDEEWDRLSREEIREVMERSNQIWKERKWIESGKGR